MAPAVIDKSCPSWPVSIFIAGDVDLARETCRVYCNDVGLCVTVTPTCYIYTGGEESGVIVGLINYPRFPSSADRIFERAFDLACGLRHALAQESFSIQTPQETVSYFFGSRTADVA